MPKSKVLVAQGGGPTAVINQSLAGVVLESRKGRNASPVYGAFHGVRGIIDEDFIDLSRESAATLEKVAATPSSALGSTRDKPDEKYCHKILASLQAHNIDRFFYIGGNDSSDTLRILSEQARKARYPLRCVHVPKTIDNDLPHTDHCPGYGSVIRYNATTVMEIGCDVGSMATDDGACSIIEVMGRAAGWIAAGTILAKRAPSDPPHIILLPEIPLDEQAFLNRVKQTIDSLKYCVVVAGEGLKNANGDEIGADKSNLDAFGHPVLSGAAERLAEIVKGTLNLKTRTVKLGYAQRAAAHAASETDVEEAAACGEAAVRAAVHGESGYMVKLIRKSDDPYKWTTGLQSLGDIANQERLIPRDWISEDGFLPNEKFITYAKPLIQGDLHLPKLDGLPDFARLNKMPVKKELPPYGEETTSAVQEQTAPEPMPAPVVSSE